MTQQLLSAPDKILKDLSAGNITQIQTAISTISLRIMEPQAASVKSEQLKLEIVKKMLASELLERRIVGIKTLNTIVRNAQLTYSQASVFTLAQLVEWIHQHGVFDILWDAKKTHL